MTCDYDPQFLSTFSSFQGTHPHDYGEGGAGPLWKVMLLFTHSWKWPQVLAKCIPSHAVEQRPFKVINTKFSPSNTSSEKEEPGWGVGLCFVHLSNKMSASAPWNVWSAQELPHLWVLKWYIKPRLPKRCLKALQTAQTAPLARSSIHSDPNGTGRSPC